MTDPRGDRADTAPLPSPPPGIRAGFWRGQQRRVHLLYVLFALALLLAIAFLGREVGHRVDAMEAWISHLGPWATLAFLGLFIVATSLLVPDTALAIVAGTLFGLTKGVAVVALGALAAALLQYAMAGTLLRARVERMLAARPGLLAIQRAVTTSEVRLQFLVRLTPVSPPLTSYVLGAAGVGLPGFLASLTALLPALFLEVYIGYAGKHLARMASRPQSAVVLHDVLVLGGVAVTLLVMAAITRAARRAVGAAAAGAT